MAKITIQIELNKQELETLLGGEDTDNESDCCNDKLYSKEEMLAANVDELNWYTSFFNKHYLEFLRGSMSKQALKELESRINLGKQIVKSLEEQ